jgi:hypothetical protein
MDFLKKTKKAAKSRTKRSGGGVKLGFSLRQKVAQSLYL